MAKHRQGNGNDAIKTTLRCRRCRQALTLPLEPVNAKFRPEFADYRNIIPRGRFWIADERQITGLSGHVVIHCDDRLNLREHPDPGRHAGCCGKDGCNGPNLVCNCGAEVATECTDCWTSYYIHFEPDAVRLETA